MKFKFVWVGKTRDRSWKALQEEYLERLSHFVKFEITEVKDAQGPGSIDIEGNYLLAKLNHSSFVILLDVMGRNLSSHELAAEVERWQNAGHKEVVFLVGGSKGVSPQVAERADFKLSLSFLTFTHEIARVILIEQLYRAFTIIKGFPYQK
jgi:23S rRNA (pseudouridine1915-N3)-methyltransferase